MSEEKELDRRTRRIRFDVGRLAGRVDMAQGVLDRLWARTLFIVGGKDLQVLDLNRLAFAQLLTERRLEVIPGAGHLFAEPGALEEVAR